jgi:peptidoglycan/LPS O-acetylase OafA/YrhL
MVYVPLLPLIAIQVLLRTRWPGIYNLYDDWANVAYYSVFLVAGFLLACHPALTTHVEREWRRSLALAGVATAVLFVAVLAQLPAGVLLVGSAVAGWCFVVAFLGLARRYFTASGPALAYLSESAFPVYVLHQAAIVLPGYFVVGLALGIATKFVLLLLLSVALTMATYHWLVRPLAVPRFLLGMKARPAALPRPIATAPAAS